MRTPCAGASLAAILAACAASNVGTDPVVPDQAKVPAGKTLSLVSRATGVQIYECSAGKTDPAKFEWAFKAPEADLFDLSGRKIEQVRFRGLEGPLELCRIGFAGAALVNLYA